MDKLKNPKTIGIIAGVIISVLVGMLATSKPYVDAICASVCASAPVVDSPDAGTP